MQANATYLGTAQYQGYLADKWDAKGLQDNYYYQTVNSQAPLAILQEPNDLQWMNPATYQTTVDPQVFTLPSACTEKCSVFSICGLLS